MGTRLVRSGSPDLVLCDLYMPNWEGLETIRELGALYPARR